MNTEKQKAIDKPIGNSIVRENLMNDPKYSPYCGSMRCRYDNPRTVWNSWLCQFRCDCGWLSKFPEEFILQYKAKWNL